MFSFVQTGWSAVQSAAGTASTLFTSFNSSEQRDEDAAYDPESDVDNKYLQEKLNQFDHAFSKLKMHDVTRAVLVLGIGNYVSSGWITFGVYSLALYVASNLIPRSDAAENFEKAKKELYEAYAWAMNSYPKAASSNDNALIIKMRNVLAGLSQSNLKTNKYLHLGNVYYTNTVQVGTVIAQQSSRFFSKIKDGTEMVLYGSDFKDTTLIAKEEVSGVRAAVKRK